MKITAEEVLNHDIRHSPTGASSFDLDQLSKYSWTLEEIDINSIFYVDIDYVWTPNMELSTESYYRNPDPYDHEKYLRIEKEKRPNKEDQKYIDGWADEYYARKYSELATQSPAIIVIQELGRNKLRSGRHRTRSTFLIGNQMIVAYVGRIKNE